RGLAASLWGLEPEAFGSAHDGAPLTRIDVRPVLDRKLAALRAHRTQLDGDHLLRALPTDLAARHLGEEAWRASDSRADDPLARLIWAGDAAGARG
ncbi:MAG: hypothetical protein H0W96_17535, partial [Solirubrobacterales bacterium]|nr:hypothetical protein [Solirubrobacterales bacterium]